jgi:hypothetical protein
MLFNLEYNKSSLLLATNDTSFVLTKSKVASRLIRSSYETHMEILVSSEFNQNYLANNSDFNELININSNQKNIILLYRNPYTRYISGIIQDVILTIPIDFNKKTTLYPYFKKYNINTSDLDIKQKSLTHQTFSSFLTNENYKNLFKNLIYDYFMWQIENNQPINTVHTEPYLYIYNNIIQSEKINLNKSCFVNIDNKLNNLDKIILTYNKKIEKKDTLSNTLFFELVESVINSNKIIKKFISDINKIEFDAYSNIENSKFNITKISKII